MKWHARGLRFLGAFAIIVVYFAVLIYSLPSIISGLNSISQSEKPRNFQIPMYIFLNNYHGFAPGADISITLNVTYPNGTLIVDEPVFITATAILHEPTAAQSIREVEVGFQNSLQVNSTNGKVINSIWGEPVQGSLIFANWVNTTVNYTDSNHNMYIYDGLVAHANITVSWPIDGDYEPAIQWFYLSGNPYSGNTTSSFTTYTEVVIHVYPKEQLTQIETNKASLALTIALFIFTFAGVVTIARDILPEDSKKAKEDEELLFLLFLL